MSQPLFKHKARKRFGQNFLTDSQVIDKIIHAINPQSDELVFEIGPGHAAVTLPLLASGAELHLLELDRDLVSKLQIYLNDYENVNLHAVDALQADFAEISGGRCFRLVGNLPYNISTPLLFHVLKWSTLVSDMHFMLQREVVERMAASPGGKTWGRLSIMCQYHCQVIPLFTVPPQAFSPPPKVHSQFVRLVPHASPPVNIKSMDTFQKLLRQAFGMRRKTLRNGLRGLLDVSQIESAGINPGLRPEALGMQEFATLARMMD